MCLVKNCFCADVGMYVCVCVLYVCVCVYVCMCVRLLLRQLITSGMMWCDIDPYDWINKFYGFKITAVVYIVGGRGLMSSKLTK